MNKYYILFFLQKDIVSMLFLIDKLVNCVKTLIFFHRYDYQSHNHNFQLHLIHCTEHLVIYIRYIFFQLRTNVMNHD
uniref:Putative secreted protein n=1 Tax=Panstrongylus lignarius TaxID=156445 RepID=A0A224XTC1_9HEMI